MSTSSIRSQRHGQGSTTGAGLKQIYLTSIRPILEYAGPVWGGLTKGLSEKVLCKKLCCGITGTPSSPPSPSERRDEATPRVLSDVLKESSSPPHGFPPAASTSTYSLRRRRECVAPVSRTKRREDCFINDLFIFRGFVLNFMLLLTM